MFQTVLALSLVWVAGCAHHHAAPPATQTSTSVADYPYHQPLFTPGGFFATLPAAVQNSVRSQAGTAEIVNISTQTNSAGVVYTIKFRQSEIYPPLYIAADGSVLNPDMTVAVPMPPKPALSVGDLPPQVQSALVSHAGAADVVSIKKDTLDDRAVYVISFKDEAHFPKLYITADGTLLVESLK
jgi:hypothetical protein